LHIFTEMNLKLADYLQATSTQWTMFGDLPKLTLGGCLMRAHRLSALQQQFDAKELAQFQEDKRQLEKNLTSNIAMSMRRLHQEAHLFLGQWCNYLGPTHRQMVSDAAYYANVVDTRVVIEALVNKLRERPFALDENVQTELTALDNNLRHRWQSGQFVWSLLWRSAYPKDKYWWLYGYPKI